jgi:hypothetical protein
MWTTSTTSVESSLMPSDPYYKTEHWRRLSRIPEKLPQPVAENLLPRDGQLLLRATT